MPRDLAARPGRRPCSTTAAIISPPKDWDRWGDLVRALVAHLRRPLRPRRGPRAGASRSGTRPTSRSSGPAAGGVPAAVRRHGGRAVKDVDERLRVGGPSSAAAGWVDDAARARRARRAPRSTSSPPTPTATRRSTSRPTLARHGCAGRPIWWTEWGVDPHPLPPGQRRRRSPRRSCCTGCGRRGPGRRAVLLGGQRPLRGARPAARLLHGGFGLLTVGNLAQAPLLGVAARPARRRRAAGRRSTATARRPGRGLGHPARRRHGRRPASGTARWTSPSGDGDPALARQIRLAVDGAAGRPAMSTDSTGITATSPPSPNASGSATGPPTSSGRRCGRPTRCWRRRCSRRSTATPASSTSRCRNPAWCWLRSPRPDRAARPLAPTPVGVTAPRTGRCPRPEPRRLRPRHTDGRTGRRDPLLPLRYGELLDPHHRAQQPLGAAPAELLPEHVAAVQVAERGHDHALVERQVPLAPPCRCATATAS